jgi:hypothetical protein
MKTQFKTSKNTSNIFIFNIFFLLLTSGNAFGQINLNEMNGIHLDFTIKQTKKKIGQKLKLEKTKDGFGGYNLQASVVYKGVAYQLIFGSLEDENDLKSYNLNEISTRSDKAKTDLGIRIGSTLKEVQNAYKIYENKNQYPEDTTVEYYQIYDSESGHLMRFSFTDNRVSEIEIASVDSL